MKLQTFFFFRYNFLLSILVGVLSSTELLHAAESSPSLPTRGGSSQKLLKRNDSSLEQYSPQFDTAFENNDTVLCMPIAQVPAVLYWYCHTISPTLAISNKIMEFDTDRIKIYFGLLNPIFEHIPFTDPKIKKTSFVYDQNIDTLTATLSLLKQGITHDEVIHIQQSFLQTARHSLKQKQQGKSSLFDKLYPSKKRQDSFVTFLCLTIAYLHGTDSIFIEYMKTAKRSNHYTDIITKQHSINAHLTDTAPEHAYYEKLEKELFLLTKDLKNIETPDEITKTILEYETLITKLKNNSGTKKTTWENYNGQLSNSPTEAEKLIKIYEKEIQEKNEDEKKLKTKLFQKHQELIAQLLTARSAFETEKKNTQKTLEIASQIAVTQAKLTLLSGFKVELSEQNNNNPDSILAVVITPYLEAFTELIDTLNIQNNLLLEYKAVVLKTQTDQNIAEQESLNKKMHDNQTKEKELYTTLSTLHKELIQKMDTTFSTPKNPAQDEYVNLKATVTELHALMRGLKEYENINASETQSLADTQLTFNKNPVEQINFCKQKVELLLEKMKTLSEENKVMKAEALSKSEKASSYEELKKESDTLKQNLESLSLQLRAEYQQDIAEVMQERDNSLAKVTTLTNEKNDFQKKLSDQDNAILRLKDQINTLTKESDEAQTRLIEQNTALTKKRDTLEKNFNHIIKTDELTIQKELTSLKQQKQTVESNLTSPHVKGEEEKNLINAIDDLQTMLDQKQTLLKKIEQDPSQFLQISAIDQKIDTHRAQVNTATQVWQEMRHEVEKKKLLTEMKNEYVTNTNNTSKTQEEKYAAMLPHHIAISYLNGEKEYFEEQLKTIEDNKLIKGKIADIIFNITTQKENHESTIAKIRIEGIINTSELEKSLRDLKSTIQELKIEIEQYKVAQVTSVLQKKNTALEKLVDTLQQDQINSKQSLSKKGKSFHSRNPWTTQQKILTAGGGIAASALGIWILTHSGNKKGISSLWAR